MKICFSVLSILVILFIQSCANGSSESRNADTVAVRSSSDSVSNALNNYWHKYHFTANEVTQYADMIEQSLVDYLAQFPNFSIDQVNQSLHFLIKKTEQEPIFFSFLKDKFSYYLYHPNSPMRNDYYYEQVLKNYQLSPVLSTVDKERDLLVLKIIAKNQVDNKAENFQFENTKGDTDDLYAYDSSLKMLVFYDPTCSHCNEVIQEMKSSKLLNKFIHSSKIIVIAIDPLADAQAWQKYQKNISKDWVNGIDRNQNILKESIYNIQGYPTIYLIDSHNTVLLKDVYFADIEKYLSNNE